MPIIQSDFRAAWWLPGAHAQTIWPSLFRRRVLPCISWERVELDDGGGADKGPAWILFMGPIDTDLERNGGEIFEVLSSDQ